MTAPARMNICHLFPGPRTPAVGRLLGALRKGGVETMGDLRWRTAAGLLALDGIGPDSLELIRDRLAGRGMHLHGDTAGLITAGEKS